MANVSQNNDKLNLRRQLRDAAEAALTQNGWDVRKPTGTGKSSVRALKCAGKSMRVSIRTTQDQWIAFPRLQDDSGWGTLPDVDAVVAASVDDINEPKHALVHLFDGAEMRDRFQRAYDARKAAGYTQPPGRGVWIALYEPEQSELPKKVGAGAGLKHPPIARIPLDTGGAGRSNSPDLPAVGTGLEPEARLTIPEAKRRLAVEFGVEPENVKITIEG
jgi:hypothetical protein